jgi:uncharacterized protein YdbL (DUF1318 family)
MKTLNKLRPIRILTAAFCCAMFAFNLMASPLSAAKDAGLIKEVPNGYITAVGKASAATDVLVKDINQRRKAAYEKIAKQTGIKAAQVGQESYTKRHPPKK